MLDPALIIFAIEAVVRIGRKLNEVLVDETHERALVLPLGDLQANFGAIQSVEFFRRPENRHLVEAGGPYFGFDRDALAKAHATLIVLDERLGGSGTALSGATALIVEIQRFEQFKAGLGANSPAQRIVGTLVEIGVDYFSANPSALGRDSAARRVLHAFIVRIDDVEFAEGERDEILHQLLGAALGVLDERMDIVFDDVRLEVLLGGVTRAVAAELQGGVDVADSVSRKAFWKRIGRSVLRGGASAFSENADLFLPADHAASAIVESTLRQTLAGLRGHATLFTAESVEVIFDSALRAVGENAALFGDEAILQTLIERTTAVLADEEIAEIFSADMASTLLAVGLQISAENVETLIDVDSPRKELLSGTLAALAGGLSDALAGSPGFRGLLSRQQLVGLASLTFDEVARHPEQLLGDALDEPRRTALAQVIGSLASALGEDPARLTNGAGAVELARIALRVGVRNADRLVDLSSEDPTTNLLFDIVQQVASAALEADAPRGLVSRDVFMDLVAVVLPLASAHVGALVDAQSALVQQVVDEVLTLASGALEGRLNGENIPGLVERLLTDALLENVDLGAADALLARATAFLDAA